MKRICIALLLILVVQAASAQDIVQMEEKKFGVKISGFIKNDFFWDSRQTVAAREGQFLLWPDPVIEDDNGNDLNGQATFNFLSLQSRLRFAISGPDALGAKTSGHIEVDFFAQANDNINLMRLRHAFIKLNWEHSEILAGQYWNPLFVTSCFPGTVSFNTGTPLQSFARNPQLRFTYTTGGLSIIAALLSQRDHSTVGEFGGNTAYLRNSATPDMHAQLHYGTKNESGMNISGGAGFAYKTIAPRINSTIGGNTYAVKERVGGMTAMAFAKVNTKAITVKIQGRYGENISDILAISGYGVTGEDILTGERTYTPLKGMSFWAEVHTNGNPQIGVFGGMTSNMGSKEEILDTDLVFGRAVNIASLYRISPRIIYNIGKVRLALEAEYTSANYGSNYDLSYIPAETAKADNLRGLFAVYYFF